VTRAKEVGILEPAGNPIPNPYVRMGTIHTFFGYIQFIGCSF
jgi:hypothetical protein